MSAGGLRPRRASAGGAVVLAAMLTLGAETPPVRWQFNVPVPMRDGVLLRANLYLPHAEGRYPVLLVRSPYGKSGEQENAVFFAERGYAVVAQDTRGRNDSAGEWHPFRHETADGYDTIEWASRQPWSNGKVATIGASYLGMVQWLAARHPHPRLVAMVTRVCPSDIYLDSVHPGGTFGNMMPWALTMGHRTFMRTELTLPSWPRLLTHMPVAQAPAIAGYEPPFLQEWLTHAERDAFWDAVSWQDAYRKLDVPVFHSGGWYDSFQRGVINNYLAMRRHALPRVRAAQRLVIGPWVHGDLGKARPARENPFGPQAVLELRELELRWLDHYVRGIENGAEADPAVRVFAMGRNEWRTGAEWPPPDARPVRFYLHSGGHARSLAGDGVLSSQSPEQEPVDTFVYDPARPVLTNGVACCESSAPAGPVDQRPVEERQDVLVYTSAPLTNPIEASGPVTLRLFAATSGADTDWTGKLVDVAPDGFARNITDGILRARYRESFTRAVLLPPNRAHEFTIDLGYTSHVFLTGHRIRLEVASSNFPRFSRNTNTGRVPEFDARGVVAHQTVFHDTARPSLLELHVRGAHGHSLIGASAGTTGSRRTPTRGTAMREDQSTSTRRPVTRSGRRSSNSSR